MLGDYIPNEDVNADSGRRRLSGEGLYEFKWWIVEASQAKDFNFEFEFTNPEIISKYAPDKVEIELLKKNLLLSYNGLQAAVFET